MQTELQYTFGVTTILIVIFIITQITGNVKHKNLAAIRYRTLTGQFFVVFWYSMMLLTLGIAGTFNLSCWYLPLYQFFTNCSGPFTLERVFMLYTNHVLTQKKIHFARNRRQLSKVFASNAEFFASPASLHHKPTTATQGKFSDWLEHNRSKFAANSGEKLSYSKRFALQNGISQGILYGAVFFLLTPQTTNPTISFYDPVCVTAAQRIYIVIFCFLMFAIVGVLWIAKNLRGIQENLFLMKEFGSCGYLGIACALWNLCFIFLPGPMAVSFYPFFFLGNQVIAVCAMYFQNGLVVSYARKAEKSETSLQTTANASSTAGPTEAGLQEIASSQRDSAKKPNELRSQLVEILLDDEQFASFEAFLSKEFSVENGYFCRNVQRYSQMSAHHEAHASNGVSDGVGQSNKNAGYEEIFEFAEMIYEDYCMSDSRMCINISYANRMALKQLFERKKNGNSLSHGGFVTESCKVFSTASSEILNLMLHDTFRRYLRSQEYLRQNPKSNQASSAV